METNAVNYEIENNIGIIKGSNPPVNALSYEVRKGLINCLAILLENKDVKGIILIGEGRTFFAGADISEFGKPMKSPSLNEVITEFENSKKPIVAALHGTPLGGGLELAMGCNYRVALKNTMLGLPEVKLGIIPGAGGTQRLPRIVGVEKALNMITSSSPINSVEALNCRLLDEIYDNELLENSKKFLLNIINSKKHPIVKHININENTLSSNFFKDYLSMVKKKFRGRKSPIAAVNAVMASVALSFEKGLEKERELFKECHDSKESSSLIHMFFSERQALKIPDIPKDIKINKISSASVIGCGTMGGGIAMSFLNKGIPVNIVEDNEEALKKGISIIENNYANTFKKGKISQDDINKRMKLLETSVNIESIKNSDITIEAVFEEMELKKNLFRKIDQFAKEGSILATNTSTLDIDEIAAVTNRPKDVIGTHFFSPANVMRLLEVVKGKHTSKEVIATTMQLAKEINKVPVLAGNCDGFIGNRMFHEYIRQANALAEEGAEIERIDQVIFDFGWAMGPFAVNDLAGNDVGWRIRKRHKTEGKYDNLRYTSTVADKLCELGRYGQKTSKGFYIYDKTTRERSVDQEVNEMFKKVAEEKGIKRREISDNEILSRLNWALLLTGCMILEEGFALKASDIDVIYAYGYGYPNWRGGPMKYAEDYGLDKALREIESFRDYGDGMWPNSNLLEKLANGEKKF